MSKFDFVMFDLDGTLLNTLEDLADSVNSALANNGYRELPHENYYNIVGKGAYNLITQALPEEARDESVITRVHGDFSEIYAGNYHVKTRVYDGISQALLRIEETGVAMAVLSNKPDRYMNSIKERYFAGLNFKAFRGKREGITGKPDPAGVKLLASEVGASLDNAIYIGDSSVDIQTAKNCGIFACGVLWGFRTREELENFGADLIVSSPSELADFLVANINTSNE